MTNRVTVYDIAKKLKISPSTVSRVLNNSNLISDERSRQIQETAEEMGYRPRAIKKQESRAILNIHLFLPTSDSTLAHFFYNVSELLDSIQEGFGGVRLNIITRINDGNLDFLSFKKTGHIDGCIFAFTKPTRKLSEALIEREIPAVLLNRRSRQHACIYYDTSKGTKTLADKVYEKRGNDIRACYVAFSGLKSLSMSRFRGAKESFEEHKIAFDEQNLIFMDDLNTIPDRILPWIKKNRFNTVIAFNDYVAMALFQAMLRRGIKIPEEISLTGFSAWLNRKSQR